MTSPSQKLLLIVTHPSGTPGLVLRILYTTYKYRPTFVAVKLVLLGGYQNDTDKNAGRFRIFEVTSNCLPPVASRISGTDRYVTVYISSPEPYHRVLPASSTHTGVLVPGTIALDIFVGATGVSHIV